MSSVPTSFWEWVLTLDKEAQIGVMVFGVVALLLMTIIICITIYSVHKNRLDDALKRELLERGMSAEEIATVIRAKPTGDGACGSRNS
jgi:hypothetical protein